MCSLRHDGAKQIAGEPRHAAAEYRPICDGAGPLGLKNLFEFPNNPSLAGPSSAPAHAFFIAVPAQRECPHAALSSTGMNLATLESRRMIGSLFFI